MTFDTTSNMLSLNFFLPTFWRFSGLAIWIQINTIFQHMFVVNTYLAAMLLLHAKTTVVGNIYQRTRYCNHTPQDKVRMK